MYYWYFTRAEYGVEFVSSLTPDVVTGNLVSYKYTVHIDVVLLILYGQSICHLYSHGPVVNLRLRAKGSWVEILVLPFADSHIIICCFERH